MQFLVATTGLSAGQLTTIFTTAKSALSIAIDQINRNESNKKQKEEFLYNGIRSMYANCPKGLFPIIINVDQWGYKIVPDEKSLGSFSYQYTVGGSKYKCMFVAQGIFTIHMRTHYSQHIQNQKDCGKGYRSNQKVSQYYIGGYEYALTNGEIITFRQSRASGGGNLRTNYWFKKIYIILGKPLYDIQENWKTPQDSSCQII